MFTYSLPAPPPITSTLLIPFPALFPSPDVIAPIDCTIHPTGEDASSRLTCHESPALDFPA